MCLLFPGYLLVRFGRRRFNRKEKNSLRPEAKINFGTSLDVQFKSATTKLNGLAFQFVLIFFNSFKARTSAG